MFRFLRNPSQHQLLEWHRSTEFLAQFNQGRVEVDATDPEGMRLLQHAAREGFDEIVLKLLHAGANPEHVQLPPDRKYEKCHPSQKTALYHALENNHELIIQILMLCGDTKKTLALLKRDGRDDLIGQIENFTINKEVLVNILYWLIKNYQPGKTARLVKTILDKIKKDLKPEQPAHSVVIDIADEAKQPLLHHNPYLISASEMREELHGLLELAAKDDREDVVQLLLDVTNKTARTNADVACFEYWRKIRNHPVKISDDDFHIFLTLQQIRRFAAPELYREFHAGLSLDQQIRLRKLRLPPEESKLNYAEKAIYEEAELNDLKAQPHALDLLKTCQTIYMDKNDWIGAMKEAIRQKNFVAIQSLIPYFDRNELFKLALEERSSSFMFMLIFHFDAYPYELIRTFRGHLKPFFQVLQGQVDEGMGLEVRAFAPNMPLIWKGLAVRMIRHSHLGLIDSRNPIDKETQGILFNEFAIDVDQFVSICYQHIFNLPSEITLDELLKTNQEKLHELAKRCGIKIKKLEELLEKPEQQDIHFFRAFNSPGKLTYILKGFLDPKEMTAFALTSRKSYTIMMDAHFALLSSLMSDMKAEIAEFPWYKNRFTGLGGPTLRVASFAVVLGGVITTSCEIGLIVTVQNKLRELMRNTNSGTGMGSTCASWLSYDNPNLCDSTNSRFEQLTDICRPLCNELERNGIWLIVNGSLLSASAIAGIFWTCGYPFNRNLTCWDVRMKDDLQLIYKRLSAGAERFAETPLSEFSPELQAKFEIVRKEYPQYGLDEDSSVYDFLTFFKKEVETQHSAENKETKSESKAAAKASQLLQKSVTEPEREPLSLNNP